jgi:2-polyprenyl-3-methyl-5-hydroxy-6-metoxy-1,4-benzoquinol methylase
MNRMRDAPIVIPGDYQYVAATRGPRVQRFWHYTKKLAIDRYLPPSATDVVIDAGCGSGVITGHLGQSGARVIGLDSNESSIAFAQRTFGAHNVEFHAARLDQLHLDRPADKIYCLEVIEHLTREEAADMLDGFSRVLRPGGRVFLTTPNVRSVWPLIEWAADRSGLVAPMGGAQHVEMYHGRTLSALAERHGFRTETMTSMCLLSPWAALLGWSVARRLFDLEARLPGLPGPILVAVFTKA